MLAALSALMSRGEQDVYEDGGDHCERGGEVV